MSDAARNIYDGFKTLREFCGQVSLLLKTADTLMERHGWDVAAPLVFSNTSRSIDQPEIWLPTEFCRYYKNTEYPHLLAFVAVNLHDPVKPNETVINEALLSAGWFDWESGKEPKVWDYWYCRAHIFRKDREDNGKLLSSNEPLQVCRNFSTDVTKVTTFAYPLDEITGSDKLEQLIIQRLLDEIIKASEIIKTSKES